jgi:hypothetical protein
VFPALEHFSLKDVLFYGECDLSPLARLPHLRSFLLHKEGNTEFSHLLHGIPWLRGVELLNNLPATLEVSNLGRKKFLLLIIKGSHFFWLSDKLYSFCISDYLFCIKDFIVPLINPNIHPNIQTSIQTPKQPSQHQNTHPTNHPNIIPNAQTSIQTHKHPSKHPSKHTTNHLNIHTHTQPTIQTPNTQLTTQTPKHPSKHPSQRPNIYTNTQTTIKTALGWSFGCLDECLGVGNDVWMVSWVGVWALALYVVVECLGVVN